MSNVLLLSLFFACTITSVLAFGWRVADIAHWAMSCTFRGGNIGNKTVIGELCASECTLIRGWTHFSWTEINNGTCFFNHSDEKIDKKEAVFMGEPGAACGILSAHIALKASPTPVSIARADGVNSVWNWLGSVLGAIAILIGGVLTAYLSRGYWRKPNENALATSSQPVPFYEDNLVSTYTPHLPRYV